MVQQVKRRDGDLVERHPDGRHRRPKAADDGDVVVADQRTVGGVGRRISASAASTPALMLKLKPRNQLGSTSAPASAMAWR
jgi:hypothetical protein